MIDGGVITLGEIPLVHYATGKRDGTSYRLTRR
jgi:hypothetical protein